MLERTRAAAAQAGLTNVETVQGEMEAIPLADGSVDHVISNGVINLSPRKSPCWPSARACSGPAAASPSPT